MIMVLFQNERGVDQGSLKAANKQKRELEKARVAKEADTPADAGESSPTLY
jgi:hypothetical protein